MAASVIEFSAHVETIFKTLGYHLQFHNAWVFISRVLEELEMVIWFISPPFKV